MKCIKKFDKCEDSDELFVNCGRLCAFNEVADWLDRNS